MLATHGDSLSLYYLYDIQPLYKDLVVNHTHSHFYNHFPGLPKLAVAVSTKKP